MNVGWLCLVAVGISTICAACCYVTAALAQGPTLVKREILALYDGAQEGADANLTRIHRFAEMPLNHLGFILRFRDIRAKLPEPAEVERYRGVLTWFVGSVSDSNAYLAWASQVSRMNVHYVILGDVGGAINPDNFTAVNRLLDLSGLRHTGDYVTPTVTTRIVQNDPDLIEFECRLGPALPDYPVINVARAGTRVGLLLETPEHDGKRQTALVAIGNKGGYAALNYEFCHQRPPLYQGKWLINPFAFFRAALGFDDFPVPDTTTASGRRLYFSQLKSDGWTRSSKIDGFRDTETMAAEVVLRELINPFHDLPTTIDLQEHELASSGRSAGQARLIMQRALAGPNVDPSRRHLRMTLSRFDPEYPSISNLSPLISAGPEPAVNSPMSDETAYSGVGPVGENGFFVLKETLTNTDSPRRLKPFNLNYHAYVGEYPALLQSVREQLQGASVTALTPVSANRYASIVDGFFTARIDRVASATWQIHNRGALQTVRFDQADGKEVDLRSSIGVIGESHNGSVLYVALDEAIEPAVVVLSSHPLSPTVHNGLALVESRWLLRNIVNGECGLSFEAQGYGNGAFSWSGAAHGRYVVTVVRSGAEVWRQNAEGDDTGRIDFVLPVSATDPVIVRMSCAGAGGSAAP
ncbi:MAG TPA: hypothetical protein VLJ17_21225 [Xanthobacteraceae bacterium]|nr:hypothetical protein [Xanthobacteraceae bacterium]